MNSSSQIEEIRNRSTTEKADLYAQLKEQLLHEVERYRTEGEYKIANIISASLSE